MEVNNIYNLDCKEGLKLLDDNSIDLVITSPPYYNAREYSQWKDLDNYLDDMKTIFSEVKRVVKNYNNIVVNVGDIVGKTNGKSSSNRKIPLGAYFIVMLEDLGFVFIDDIIWDKGEVQSKRNFVGEPYPFQKYPINSYEHILIFRKFEVEDIKPNCPECGKNIAVINGVVNKTHTFECKNPNCKKSKSGRGVRYSSRQLHKNKYQVEGNKIDEDILRLFRRDIVKINPVIKINNKGENKLNHSAPFPEKIPEFAIKFYSGVEDIVLDIFSGSGTTCKVAKQLGRKFVGFEIDNTYYKDSLDKIK